MTERSTGLLCDLCGIEIEKIKDGKKVTGFKCPNCHRKYKIIIEE